MIKKKVHEYDKVEFSNNRTKNVFIDRFKMMNFHQMVGSWGFWDGEKVTGTFEYLLRKNCFETTRECVNAVNNFICSVEIEDVKNHISIEIEETDDQLIFYSIENVEA